MNISKTDKTVDKVVGEYMARKRKEHKISQKLVAKEVGITAVYYRSIEKGLYRPTWTIFVSICSVLGIDINTLIEQFVKPNATQG